MRDKKVGAIAMKSCALLVVLGTAYQVDGTAALHLKQVDIARHGQWTMWGISDRRKSN